MEQQRSNLAVPEQAQREQEKAKSCTPNEVKSAAPTAEAEKTQGSSTPEYQTLVEKVVNMPPAIPQVTVSLKYQLINEIT
jgi:hypothetical protein